jgi:hypothetical protein
MVIPPAALLIPYLLGLLAFAIIGSFAMYRLLRFGAPSAGSWLMILAFCLGTALVMATSLWQLTAIDWTTARLQLSDNPTPAAPYAYPALD